MLPVSGTLMARRGTPRLVSLLASLLSHAFVSSSTVYLYTYEDQMYYDFEKIRGEIVHSRPTQFKKPRWP